MLKLNENEKNDLQETVKLLKEELEKTREQNKNLCDKYDELQKEIANNHEQIVKQANLSHLQLEEIEKLRTELENRKKSDNSSEYITEYKNLLREKEQEINEMKKNFSTMSTDQTYVNSEQYKIQMENYHKEIFAKDNQLEEMKLELMTVKGMYEELKAKTDSTATIKIEIDQLRSDNKTLINYLRKTKEYKNFAEYIDDSNGAVQLISSKGHKCWPSRSVFWRRI